MLTDRTSEDIAIDGSSLQQINKLVIKDNKNIVGGNLRLSASGNQAESIEVTGNIFSDIKDSPVMIKNASTTAKGNRISQNYFYNNGGIPIDLVFDGTWKEGDGETANTGGYVEGKPNRGVDRPVLTSALLVKARTLEIKGVLQEETQSLEFYLVSNSKYEYLDTFTKDDGIFSGEKGSYIDPISKKEISQQKIEIEWTRFGEKAGTTIAAIAIDKDGNTSEFSPIIHISEPATITTTVWKDDNKNGNPDVGESRFDGIKVKLSRIPSTEAPVVVKTDKQGEISFNNLNSGQYQVEVLPDQPKLAGLALGKDMLNPQVITLGSGDSANALFGYIEGSPTLSLTPNHHRTVIPGTKVSFLHTLKSSEAGEFDLSAVWDKDDSEKTGSAKKALWPLTIRSFSCNASPDSAKAITNNRLTIEARNDNGKTVVNPVCLEASFFVPANSPYGLNRSLTLTAKRVTEKSGGMVPTVPNLKKS